MHPFNLLPLTNAHENSIPNLGSFRLILMKHAMPVLQPGITSQLWLLSEDGRCAAQALADDLRGYNFKTIISSHEPKAQATAEEIASVLALPVEVAPNLHEHQRDAADWMESKEAFESRVRLFFDAPDALVFGVETANQALARFTGAVSNVIAQHPNQDIAIVSHGTVISLLVSCWAGVAPFPLWQRLALPDIVVLRATPSIA